MALMVISLGYCAWRITATNRLIVRIEEHIIRQDAANAARLRNQAVVIDLVRRIALTLGVAAKNP
jgi:hypothetical protein